MNTKTFLMAMILTTVISLLVSAAVVTTIKHAKSQPQCVKERWL